MTEQIHDTQNAKPLPYGSERRPLPRPPVERKGSEGRAIPKPPPPPPRKKD